MKSIVFALTIFAASISYAASVCTIAQASGVLTTGTATVSGDNGVAVSAACTDNKDSMTVTVKTWHKQVGPGAGIDKDAQGNAQNIAAAWAKVTQDLLNRGYSPVSDSLFTK